MIRVREADEGDVAGVRKLFFATYDEDYTYKDFYDEAALKRIIYGDDTLFLVAEDTSAGTLVGTASVLLEVGAYSDLVGEFGRLVVHPARRNEGIGHKLMEARLERVRDRLHVGITEARVVHPYTQRIALKQGFAVVGFLPLKWPFGEVLESQALFARYFGDALELRKNHPRMVPEVFPLAHLAMENLGLEPDAILDESAQPYPPAGEYRVEHLTSEGYSTLLRIERGRVRKREVFGPMRLHYGFFKLTTEHSDYLVARQGDRITGALGFTIEPFDRLVKIFELIPVEEGAVRFLFQELERFLQAAETEFHYLEIDVRAAAPRLQRTLVELGYLPVAYLPALAFRRVERLDVVRMVRLLKAVDPGPLDLLPSTRSMADLVLEGFRRRRVLPRIAELVGETRIFDGLSPEQGRRLAGSCGHARFDAGQTIFRQGEERDELYLVLSGEVEVEIDGTRVGTVRTGECLGEVALLEDCCHSATARAVTAVEAAVLGRSELLNLVRRRPDIGVILYRNLARDLGTKLQRADGLRS